MENSRYEFLKKVIIVDYNTFRKGLEPDNPNMSPYGAFNELDGIRSAHREILGVHSPFLTTDEISRLYGLNETAYTKEANNIRKVF